MTLHGINLFDMGLKGRLPTFITDFLTDRHFKVRINSTMTDPFEQEMEVSQGSILAVTLFSIKIISSAKHFKTTWGTLYM